MDDRSGFVYSSVSRGDYPPIGHHHSYSTDKSEDSQFRQQNLNDAPFPFDRGVTARRITYLAIALACLLGVGAIGAGVYIAVLAKRQGDSIILIFGGQPTLFIAPGHLHFPMSSELVQVSRICLSILVTIVTDSTGLAHATALKWALAAEGKLTFNANLRLIKASGGRFSANGRVVNTLFGITLVLSYAASALMFMEEHGGGQDNGLTNQYVFLSYAPPIVLGVSFLTQGLLSLNSLLWTRIETWSTSPLDVVPALSNAGFAVGMQGRCMRPLSHSLSPNDTTPVPAVVRQASAWSSYRTVKRIVIIVWILILVGVIWGYLSWKSADASVLANPSWSPFPNTNSPSATVIWPPESLETILDTSFVVSCIFLMAAVQFLFTLSVHACDLIAMISRDEDAWRRTGSSKGAGANANPIVAVLSSWESLIMTILKSLIHYLFGNALTVIPGSGLGMMGVQIWYLTFAWVALTLVITYLAFRRPTGPQPSAYGHVQTLLNLVDEWHKPVMFWGHKGYRSGDNVYHAGTSGEPLAPVAIGAYYAGSD